MPLSNSGINLVLLVADLLTLRPRFEPRPLYLGYVIDKVAVRQVAVPVLRLPPVSVYKNTVN
jgi:hypothetical protein